MALDTPQRRSSAIHPSLPWRGLWPIPDATIDVGDRQQTAFLYSGISAGVAIVVQPSVERTVYVLAEHRTATVASELRTATVAAEISS